LKSDAPNAARRKAERGARSAPQRRAHRLVDLLILPAVILAALVLRFARRTGLHRLPLTRRALLRIGVLPILDHYYEPRFRYDGPLPDAPRSLPGIRWNDAAQLALLERLTHAPELVDGQLPARGPRRFAYENGYFGPGDAEFLYSAIRHFRPARIMEVGSGHSTLVAAAAIDRNRADDPSYDCRHVCIEPYEHDWLEELGVEVVRRPVESLDPAMFQELAANDILFIDSSHVIRPGGDVLYEYLQLLPRLRPGVLVHVHDIFSPYDYPDAWLRHELKLWNEQYLLEAWLSASHDFEIIGALHYLSRHHRHHLERAFPAYARVAGRHVPGSFWIRRTEVGA
jgi:predicted O-methyltransferase YrrM